MEQILSFKSGPHFLKGLTLQGTKFLSAKVVSLGKLVEFFRCYNTGLIELGFNDMSTLVGHFVSSSREREEKDRRDSRGDEREGQGRKRNRNESEETEEIKTSPSTLTCYKDSRPCPAVSQYQLGAPVT